MLRNVSGRIMELPNLPKPYVHKLKSNLSDPNGTTNGALKCAKTLRTKGFRDFGSSSLLATFPISGFGHIYFQGHPIDF